MTPDAAQLWTAWTRQNDERAFETLVTPELPHAMRFARRLGCDQADADDALQDALARLATRHDDGPVSVGLRAWLCREVHNYARSHLRSERRRKRREAVVADSEVREDAEPAFALREEVEAALAQLRDDDRTAVELRFLHDLDYPEMALVLDASQGACRQRVQKALARLRERLGKNAAALVAALPLPPVRHAPALVKAALAKSAVAAATAAGATVMATTNKLIITAVVAIALGIAGTLAAQRLAAPGRSGDSDSLGPSSNELAKKDAEIARLRGLLADAGKHRVSSRSSEPGTAEVPPSRDAPATRDASARPASETAAQPQAPAVDVATAEKQAEAWQAALRQVADQAKRDAVWRDVRAALAGADRTTLYAALRAAAFTRDVTLDRAGLRDLLLPSVDAQESQIRLAAWQALINTGIEPIDVAKLRAQVAAASDDVRSDLVLRLNWALKGVIDGENADVVLQLLSDANACKSTVQALHGARLPDSIVAKVLEYARSGSDAAALAERYVLRDLPDKNHDVVAYLLDRAESGALSLDGLNVGIHPDDVAYVGERLRKLYAARNDAYQRSQIIETIGRIGDAASRDWLMELRDDATQDALVRNAARGAVQFIDRPRR